MHRFIFEQREHFVEERDKLQRKIELMLRVRESLTELGEAFLIIMNNDNFNYKDISKHYKDVSKHDKCFSDWLEEAEKKVEVLGLRCKN